MVKAGREAVGGDGSHNSILTRFCLKCSSSGKQSHGAQQRGLDRAGHLRAFSLVTLVIFSP